MPGAVHAFTSRYHACVVLARDGTLGNFGSNATQVSPWYEFIWQVPRTLSPKCSYFGGARVVGVHTTLLLHLGLHCEM